MNIQFRDIQGDIDVLNLIDFLLEQDLGYKNYRQWIEKTEHELKTGSKEAVTCHVEGMFAGDVVYQRHKTIPLTLGLRVVEIKNIRVVPGERGRMIAPFSVRQVEYVLQQSGLYDGVIVDARAEQREMVRMLRKQGYGELARLDIYNSGSEDVVMAKFFDHSQARLWLPRQREIVKAHANLEN